MHRSANASAIFEIEEESAGTQRLFAFAAPIIEALKVGRVVVADELDGSLHSHITRFLVQLFHRPTDGGSTAQLIEGLSTVAIDNHPRIPPVSD